MNKSYNLFGLYPDHVCISNAIQYEADYPADIQDYNIEYNLFDMKRFVNSKETNDTHIDEGIIMKATGLSKEKKRSLT